MKKVKRILFPTDFSNASHNAFRYALWFADHYGASIELLHVVVPEVEPLDLPVTISAATKGRIEAARDLMKTFTESALAQLQSHYEPENLPDVHPNVQLGIPSFLIPQIAQKNEADLILMGSKLKHSMLEKAFGTMSTTIMEKAHCPVLLVPEYVNLERLVSVTYAADLDESEPYHIWEAGQFLSPFNVIMRVVHVQKSRDEKPTVNMDELAAFFGSKPPVLQITFHNIPGENILEELEEFADTWDTDMLILHKPKRSFFDRIFHQSITRKVALYSK
ncbi:MAG: universal stress protein, partial [Bacteroidetes bacterium]